MGGRILILILIIQILILIQWPHPVTLMIIYIKRYFTE